jgi:serine protease Do
VSIQDVDPATAEAMGLESHKGVLIGDVFKGQPADKAGIKRGDVVVSIDGKKVDDSNQLRNTVATIPAGQSVPVELIRRNKKMTLKVTISERDEKTVAQAGASEEGQQPEDQREIDAGKMLGLRLGELSAELRQKLNIERAAKGVVVLDVEQNGAAARNGIKQYDVILEYNQQPVETLGDFKQINKGVKENQPVLFLIQRGNNTLYVAFKLR